MKKFELIVPTIFGLESFVAREIKNLGYEISRTEDGRVTFWGDEEAICRANMWIRTGERVLIKMAEFEARSFDELFEGTKAVKWSEWINKNSKFPVKGFCLKSTLASVRDCQAIIKKAAAASLGADYGMTILEETAEVCQIQFSIMKDRVTLMIDTSGDGLHKRGYRPQSNAAPLKETIAAAMVMISRWKYELPLCDPLCGSGTIPIEAAMLKRSIAPGMTRRFLASDYPRIGEQTWERAVEEARDSIKNIPLEIYASDIDHQAVEIANENARRAGVGDAVTAECAAVEGLSVSKPYGTIICNPPYGERLGDAAEAEELYKKMGEVFSSLDRWSYFVITSNEGFEGCFGRKADKKRKIYNGMLKCNIYQYFGERPKIFKTGEIKG